VKDGPPEETKEKIIQFLKQIVSEAIQQRNELETEGPPVREILRTVFCSPLEQKFGT